MTKRPKPGSIEQKRQSALRHRIMACETRSALRRVPENMRSATRRAARIHESLVRQYTRDIQSRAWNK